MNPSKKPLIIGVVVVIIILAFVAFFMRGSTSAPATGSPSDTASAPTDVASGSTPVAVSETTKVSGSLSEYQNAELGFLVKYPNTWEKEETNAGVTFVIPIDKAQVSTVATLQATVQAVPGTCAFPPVTTVQSHDTLKVGANSFNSISMSNTVQGRVYFNRMYSLQHADICYIFSFASITLAPSSKGLTGSNVTQAQNNNKAIVNTADTDFTAMVKSFAYIMTPAGQDETKAAPKK